MEVLFHALVPGSRSVVKTVCTDKHNVVLLREALAGACTPSVTWRCVYVGTQTYNLMTSRTWRGALQCRPETENPCTDVGITDVYLARSDS